MTRREDWRTRLAAYVASVRFQPYSHGVLDSWLFVGGAVEAMTGVDTAASERGRYSTAKGALRIIKLANAADLADYTAARFEELDAPAFAQIGDVMAIPVESAFAYALGILNGERILVVTPHGIDSRDRSEATRAFRV